MIKIVVAVVRDENSNSSGKSSKKIAAVRDVNNNSSVKWRKQ